LLSQLQPYTVVQSLKVYNGLGRLQCVCNGCAMAKLQGAPK